MYLYSFKIEKDLWETHKGADTAENLLRSFYCNYFFICVFVSAFSCVYVCIYVCFICVISFFVYMLQSICVAVFEQTVVTR